MAVAIWLARKLQHVAGSLSQLAQGQEADDTTFAVVRQMAQSSRSVLGELAQADPGVEQAEIAEQLVKRRAIWEDRTAIDRGRNRGRGRDIYNRWADPFGEIGKTLRRGTRFRSRCAERHHGR